MQFILMRSSILCSVTYGPSLESYMYMYLVDSVNCYECVIMEWPCLYTAHVHEPLHWVGRVPMMKEKRAFEPITPSSQG